jgi:hypothetical protein
MRTDGIVYGIAKEPSHQQVADWLVDAYTSIPTNGGRNAWMKSGYAWCYLNYKLSLFIRNIEYLNPDLFQCTLG